jgi:hypothetical protein
LYESELRKNKQLKQLLADQGARLAAAPATSARRGGHEEGLAGGGKLSVSEDFLQPQFISQSKIMVELRRNDQAKIEAELTERRASVDADASGATTLYGGLYKQGTGSPTSQRVLAQPSPRGAVRGSRRVSSIEERDRPGE